MKSMIAVCTIIALGIGMTDPLFAQSSPPASQPEPMPSNTMSGAPAPADLTGQTIYDVEGTALGTVSSMGADGSGQPVAVVAMAAVKGLIGKNLLFPVGSLKQRNQGGYTTVLTIAEIRKLPKVKG